MVESSWIIAMTWSTFSASCVSSLRQTVDSHFRCRCSLLLVADLDEALDSELRLSENEAHLSADVGANEAGPIHAITKGKGAWLKVATTDDPPT